MVVRSLPWALLGLVWIVVPAAAQPPAIESLVEQLGADRFETRRAAAQQLRGHGLKAQAALRAALTHEEPEIRFQARRILAQLDADDLERRLKIFAQHPDDAAAHQLPMWRPYREIAGRDAEAVNLFAAMQRRAHPLLQAAAEGRAKALWTGDQELLSFAIENPFPSSLDEPDFRWEPFEMVAVTLLLASQPKSQVPLARQHALLGLLATSPEIGDALERSRQGQQTAVRRLLRAWVCSGTDAERIGFHLQVATSLDLPERIEVAAAALKAPDSGYGLSAVALPIVAKLGSPKHLPLVENCFQDESDVQGYQFGNRVLTQQVRDIALVTALQLTKQSLRDYGFKQLVYPSYDEKATVFPTDEARTAAFKMWARWRAAHPNVADEGQPRTP